MNLITNKVVITILQSDLPKANAQCVICGRKYYVCEKCVKMHYNGIESWRLFCDSPKCYEAYIILQDYNHGRETKEATLERLADYNIDKEMLGSEMGAIYDGLTKEDKPVATISEQLIEEKPVQVKKDMPEKQYGYYDLNKKKKKNRNR